MSILQPLGGGTGVLKFGARGETASGKTLTTFLLACGVRRHFELDGPIVMLDTEGGSPYLDHIAKSLTGKELIGLRSKAFDDLVAALNEAEKIGAAGFIADSITHPWRELCDSYLARVNRARKGKGLPERQRLTMPNWGPLKEKWNKQWTERYINSPVHTYVCGRLGFTWDYVTDEESGQEELRQTGHKMKTETEFGYESSLSVEMERISDMRRGPQIDHRCIIIKDRFNVQDGEVGTFKSERDPEKAMAAVMRFFMPHISMLTPGVVSEVDTKVKSNVATIADVDTYSRKRKILIDKIKALFKKYIPGMKAEDKKRKVELLEQSCGTSSWTEVEGYNLKKLSDCYEALIILLEKK